MGVFIWAASSASLGGCVLALVVVDHDNVILSPTHLYMF